ncbi:MAG: GGDEF domain-containing protein, partial [Coprococcus sp.]
QAFIKALKDNGLEYNDRMFVQGDFSGRSKGFAAQLLNNNPDVEAIFCVNDDTTMGLYEELKERKLRAGRDVSVFGYDDSAMAAIASPSLSTIRADSAQMGYEALKMAVKLLNGEDIKEVVVPTEFILRDSICINGEQKRKRLGFRDIFYGNFFDIHQERVNELSIIYRQLSTSIEGISPKGFKAYSDEYNNIIHHLERFCEQGALHYADMNKFMLAIGDMERDTLANCDKEERDDIRQLFSDISKKVVLYMNEHFGDLKKDREHEGFEIKVFAHNMLQFDRGWEQSYGILLQNLEWLNIKTANIYMYEEPILHLYGKEFELPDKVYLKATLCNGKVNAVLGKKQQYDVNSIFQKTVFSNNDIQKTAFLPLFFRELIYGFLICDITDELFMHGELLLNQMSAAVKMIKLLQINEDIQQKLEENLVVLKENNVKLDNLSKSDVLTGILNRRGFLAEADNFFKEKKSRGRCVAILYIDMNNLKIINDGFGHDEGDFSLKLIGTILSEQMSDCGIAGRIGGDEYACVFSAPDADACKAVVNDIYNCFAVFNKNSDKVYNITVSIGVFISNPDNNISLEDAMIQADESLYQVKKHRTKDVLKVKC